MDIAKRIAALPKALFLRSGMKGDEAIHRRMVRRRGFWIPARAGMTVVIMVLS
jgi:hypothetical protein